MSCSLPPCDAWRMWCVRRAPMMPLRWWAFQLVFAEPAISQSAAERWGYWSSKSGMSCGVATFEKWQDAFPLLMHTDKFVLKVMQQRPAAFVISVRISSPAGYLKDATMNTLEFHWLKPESPCLKVCLFLLSFVYESESICHLFLLMVSVFPSAHLLCCCLSNPNVLLF